MEKSEKSFIKVDVNIDGEVCNNKLMDKIAGVTGIIFGPYREKKLARTKFLQEINGREDLTNIEKLAITSNYKKILKEYENQNDIVNKNGVTQITPDIGGKNYDQKIQRMCKRAA